MYISIGEIKTRIIYPLMEDAGEYVCETFLYLMDVLERQFALIELAFKEYVVDYLVHQRCNPGRCRVSQDP